MEHESEHREIRVLLVSGNEYDIGEVKNHLEKTMGALCLLQHCVCISGTLGFFGKEIRGVDIIILDLGLLNAGKPQEIFRRMKRMAGDIPIIVLTERADHELALLVMEEGAADNITRGQFSTDPFKLRDTIEFSIARDDISKRSVQQNAEHYRHLEKQSAIDIDGMKRHEKTAIREVRDEAAAVLRDVLDHNTRDINDVKAETETLLDALRRESAAMCREKDQIINWMGGGYSFERI